MGHIPDFSTEKPYKQPLRHHRRQRLLNTMGSMAPLNQTQLKKQMRSRQMGWWNPKFVRGENNKNLWNHDHLESFFDKEVKNLTWTSR